MNDREISTADLSLEEQEHVRNAIILLKSKLGGWKTVGKVLRFEDTTLIHVAHGRRSVSVLMAFRISRLVKMPVEDVLAGKFPNDACARCGYRMPEKRGAR